MRHSQPFTAQPVLAISAASESMPRVNAFLSTPNQS
jgi:hypothetical protein